MIKRLSRTVYAFLMCILLLEVTCYKRGVIQVKQMKHAGHYWRSKEKLINFLLWTPSHKRSSIDSTHAQKTYLLLRYNTFHLHTLTHIHIYIWKLNIHVFQILTLSLWILQLLKKNIYIYIIILSTLLAWISMSPDPLSPPASIVHRSRKVFQASSCIDTELLYIGSCWLSNLFLVHVQGSTRVHCL